MRLFKDNGDYTEEGSALDLRFGNKLAAIVKELDNPRELHALVDGAVIEAVCAEMISRRFKANETAKAP